MTAPTFDFVCRDPSGSAYPFTTVSFTGNEGISRLYRYQIELKMPIDNASEIELDDLLESPVSFIFRDRRDYPVHGVLDSLHENQTAAGYVYFTAVLVPRLWKLSVARTNQVFTSKDITNMTIIDIVSQLLDQHFSQGKDADYYFEVADEGQLIKREYVCQFGESDFSFLSRLLEYEGISYYFSQSNDHETLIITDTMEDVPFDRRNARVGFDTAATGDAVYRSVTTWSCQKKRLPEGLTVRDFDPEQPSYEVFANNDVDKNSGLGIEYLYGENFTGDYGQRLARIRSDELLCQKTRFLGDSGVAGLRSGHVFTLVGDKQDLNPRYNEREYLLTSINHEGRFLDSTDESDSRPYYRNQFVAIDSTVQYRPPRLTSKPRFYGTMTAFIYSEDGVSTQIDDQGRYLVSLPFDKAGANENKAVHRVRMAQSYLGEGEGMFYPLDPNTEVLLTFLNGDPDRPIIVSPVPNAAKAGVSTGDENVLHEESHKGYFFKIIADPWTVTNHIFYQMDNSAQVTLDAGTPKQLDEKSGGYIVERLYGPQYNWIDGPSYTWDQQPSYNFGNSYQETHQKIDYINPCDTDKEVFTIPTKDAMRNGLVKLRKLQGKTEARDAVVFQELEDGLVEKVWGDKYEYQKGNTHILADDNNKTYAYGNGYTENLVEGDIWPADKSTYDKMTGFTANKTLIEKTYGNSYDFQYGDNLEIVKGNPSSKIYGNTNEEIHGNQDSHVWGHQTSIIEGTATEITLYNQFNLNVGGVEEVLLGGNVEFLLGGEFELSPAGKVEIDFPFKTGLGGGIAIDSFNGLKMDYVDGLQINMESGGKIEIDATTEIKQVGAVKIDNITNQLKKGQIDFVDATLKLAFAPLTMIG